jgi:hypothetical protein
MLRGAGYWPRDKTHILGGANYDCRRGWYIHVARAIGNPYCADLIILDRRGRYLEIELKTSTGPVSDIQKALIASDGIPIARSVEEARRLVEEWEAEGKDGAK